MYYKDILNSYFSKFIYKTFPLEWREWWFNEIVLQFSAYHSSILIAGPQSILMDRTKDL